MQFFPYIMPSKNKKNPSQKEPSNSGQSSKEKIWLEPDTYSSDDYTDDDNEDYVDIDEDSDKEGEDCEECVKNFTINLSSSATQQSVKFKNFLARYLADSSSILTSAATPPSSASSSKSDANDAKIDLDKCDANDIAQKFGFLTFNRKYNNQIHKNCEHPSEKHIWLNSIDGRQPSSFLQPTLESDLHELPAIEKMMLYSAWFKNKDITKAVEDLVHLQNNATMPKKSNKDETKKAKPEQTSKEETKQAKPEQTSKEETKQAKPEQTSKEETKQAKPEQTSKEETKKAKPEQTSKEETKKARPEQTKSVPCKEEVFSDDGLISQKRKSKKKKKRAASVAGTSSTQAPEKNQKELGEPNKDKKSNTNSAPSSSNTEISVAQNVSNVTNGGQKVKAVTKKKKTETVDEKTKMLQDFQAVVREGTEFFLKDEYSRCVECYKRVRKDYGDVLRNICSPLDHSVFIYVFCMARIFTQSYLEIIDSLHDLKVDLPAPFLMKFYGLAVAYQRLNRYEAAVETANRGLEAVGNAPASAIMYYPHCYCNYLTGAKSSTMKSTPKCSSCTLIPIPESNPDQLKSLLESLSRDCSIPRPCTARCKYVDCLKITPKISPYVVSSNLIFTTDPDFSGYVRVYCEEQCHIDYHHQCWKAYKDSTVQDIAVKISDKDFLGKPCPTLDCRTSLSVPSCIVKINIYGADNAIKSSQTNSKKKDEDPEALGGAKSGCGPKKKRNRNDSVESSPMKVKGKKKEATLVVKKGTKDTPSTGGVSKTEDVKSTEDGKPGDDKVDKPSVEKVAPKKGKHRKVKFSCVESYNRSGFGAYKPPSSAAIKAALKRTGGGTRKSSSDSQSRDFIADLEAELILLRDLREQRFGVPALDWIDVSKNYLGNSDLYNELVVQDRYSRNLNTAEELLLDLYREYLKDNNDYPLHILRPEGNENNFWNLSWTPASDILTSFDRVVSSNRYKNIAQFLTSTPEFIIIENYLCLAQDLSSCVDLLLYDPDSGDSGAVPYTHVSSELSVELLKDVDPSFDGLYHSVSLIVVDVDDAKLRTEFSMYGSVQSLNRMGSQVVITYAVKAEAMAAVTYSQREVKLVCNDPDHIVCGRNKSRSSSISDQFNPTQIDPNPQLFAFEDTAAAVFNPSEELEDAISNVNSETASIRTSDEEMTDSDSETEDEDSNEEREDEKKYEGVDINELDKLIGLDVNKAKEIKELDVNKSKEVTVDPDINKGVSNEVKDDADVPNIHEDEVTGRDTNVTNELAGKHDNDSGEKDEKDENLVENLDGKCHSENGYEKEETLKRTKDVEKLHEGMGDDIEKEDTLLQKNEDSDETKSETSTRSAKLELPSNIPDEIPQDMSSETRDVESRVESPETKALPEQLENIQDTLVADYLDTLVDIGKSELCSMNGEQTKKELVSSADKIESEKDTLRSDIVANTDASDPDTEPKCVVKEEFIEATSSPNANTNSSNDVANKDINSQVETNKLLEESSASSVSSGNDVTVINLMDEVTVANPTESNVRELEQRNLPSTTESFEGTGECDSGKEYSTDETTLPIEKGNPEDDQNESNETIRADGSAQIEKSTAVDHLETAQDAKDTLKEYEKAFDKEPETITSGYGRMRSNEIESKDDEMGNNTSGSNHTINEIETKDDEIGDNVSNTLEHADPVSKSEESEDSNPEPMVRKPSSTDSSSRDDHLESIKQALETLPDTDRSITLEKIKAWLANSEGEVDENDTKLGVNVEDCDSQKEEVDENDGQTVEDGNDSSDGSEDDNDDFDNSGDKRDAERVNPSVYTLVDGSAGISQTSTSVRSVEVSGSNSNASVTIADVYVDNYYPCVINTDAYVTNTDAYVTNTDAYATNSDDYVTKTDACVSNTTVSNPYVMSSALSTPAARPSSIEFTPWSNDSDESEYYEDFVDDLNEATGTDLSEQRRDFVVGMDLNHQWREHDRQYEDSKNQECQRCNQSNTDRMDNKQECREQCEKCNHANTDRMDYKQNWREQCERADQPGNAHSHQDNGSAVSDLGYVKRRVTDRRYADVKTHEGYRDGDLIEGQHFRDLEQENQMLRNILSDLTNETRDLKRTILDSRKAYCDYILQSQSDQCLNKLAQWDMFRSSFCNDHNRDHNLWTLLEQEESIWETRMRDCRVQAELVEEEYKSQLDSLDAMNGADIEFSLLTSSMVHLDNTCMSRYAQFFQTALDINTTGDQLYQTANSEDLDNSSHDIENNNGNPTPVDNTVRNSNEDQQNPSLVTPESNEKTVPDNVGSGEENGDLDNGKHATPLSQSSPLNQSSSLKEPGITSNSVPILSNSVPPSSNSVTTNNSGILLSTASATSGISSLPSVSYVIGSSMISANPAPISVPSQSISSANNMPLSPGLFSPPPNSPVNMGYYGTPMQYNKPMQVPYQPIMMIYPQPGYNPYPQQVPNPFSLIMYPSQMQNAAKPFKTSQQASAPNGAQMSNQSSTGVDKLKSSDVQAASSVANAKVQEGSQPSSQGVNANQKTPFFLNPLQRPPNMFMVGPNANYYGGPNLAYPSTGYPSPGVMPLPRYPPGVQPNHAPEPLAGYPLYTGYQHTNQSPKPVDVGKATELNATQTSGIDRKNTEKSARQQPDVEYLKKLLKINVQCAAEANDKDSTTNINDVKIGNPEHGNDKLTAESTKSSVADKELIESKDRKDTTATTSNVKIDEMQEELSERNAQSEVSKDKDKSDLNEETGPPNQEQDGQKTHKTIKADDCKEDEDKQKGEEVALGVNKKETGDLKPAAGSLKEKQNTKASSTEPKLETAKPQRVKEPAGNVTAITSKLETISQYLSELIDDSSKVNPSNTTSVTRDKTPIRKRHEPVLSKYNQAGATGNQKHKAKKATEPSKKLCLSEILTDFSKLCGDNDETGGPLKLDLDSEDEDAKERTTENKKTAKNENKPSKPCLRQTNPWKVHENIVERNRTVSERSNDSVASNRSRKLSQQSNESVRSETAKKSKPSKDNSGVCNTKPVLVNTGLDTGGPSSSDSWTEVVRKNLSMRVTAKAPPPSQILQDGCGQKLKKHLVAKFPSVSTDTLISLVKNVRREHGNHLTGLSFELIETLVSLQLAKQANVTESSSSGWEKFTGKAWADTKTPKTAEWKSTGQDECIICMYPLGNRTTVLDCQHVFHTQCIKTWIRVNSVCPYCKKFSTLNEDFPSLC